MYFCLQRSRENNDEMIQAIKINSKLIKLTEFLMGTFIRLLWFCCADTKGKLFENCHFSP
jgi:hypothetical protein